MSTFVLFIGGYKSKLPDIKAWLASAGQVKTGVTFDGYPYPDINSADDGDATAAFSASKHNYLAEAISKVEASPADTIFIVGHSSGCAIANKIDASLKDTKKINLVALDGFAPSPAQLERTTTQVWSAESGHGKSLNHDRMLARIEEFNKKAKNKQKVNMFTAAADCTTKYALHFSLVNLSSNDKLVKLIADGYTNCSANLPWLPQLDDAVLAPTEVTCPVEDYNSMGLGIELRVVVAAEIGSTGARKFQKATQENHTPTMECIDCLLNRTIAGISPP